MPVGSADGIVALKDDPKFALSLPWMAAATTRNFCGHSQGHPSWIVSITHLSIQQMSSPWLFITDSMADHRPPG
jgi:hypothetical protein